MINLDQSHYLAFLGHFEHQKMRKVKKHMSKYGNRISIDGKKKVDKIDMFFFNFFAEN